MKIDQDFIKKFVRYREPFLFIDEASVVDEYQTIAKYKLEKDNYILKGHFPDYPVLPGVLLVEMISQTSLLHIIARTMDEIKPEDLENFSYDAYIVKLNSFNFKNRVEPEANIEIKIEVKPSFIENFFDATGKVFVDGKLKGYGSIILFFRIRKSKKEDQ